MDILNFISWIKGGKYSTTIPSNAVTVVGVPNPNRDDKYLPVTVPVSSFAGSGSNIGKLLGGGIVVGEWDEYGVKKCLIASLTDIGTTLVWTIPAFQFGPAIGITARSLSDGFTNTNAIIGQAGILNNTYAAGAAKLHNGGGFNDWYLPSMFELNSCYNASDIVNKVLGPTNGFAYNFYWSSTEIPDIQGLDQAKYQGFNSGYQQNSLKGTAIYVRAVRIHIL